MTIEETTTNTVATYEIVDVVQINQEDYEKDLRRRQQEHLSKVYGNRPFKPCLHDQCPSCRGTGVKFDGSSCIHGLACSCPKCSPQY